MVVSSYFLHRVGIWSFVCTVPFLSQPRVCKRQDSTLKACDNLTAPETWVKPQSIWVDQL
jgi:hypothetical protein